jgi:hypothetical protein
MIPKDKIDKAKKILEINQKIKSFGTAFIAKKIDDVEEEIGSLTKIVTDYIESVPFPQDGIDGVQGEKGEKGDRGEQGLHGMKGDKGDKGERGEKGEKGEDGFGIDGKDGKNGIDGKDGSPDTGEDIVQKINALALDPDLKIDASHIKNLPINNGGSGIGGRPLFKLTTGTNLTTAEVGAIEYNNTFHVTNSDATRRHVVLAPNTTKVTASAPYTNDGYIIINIGGTDFKVMTTA